MCVVPYAVTHTHAYMIIHLTDDKKKTTDNDAIQLLFNWLQVSFEMKRSFVIKCHSAITPVIFIYPYITNVKNALARPNNLHGIAIIFWMIWCILWNAYFATWIRLLRCDFLLVAVRKSEMEKRNKKKKKERAISISTSISKRKRNSKDYEENETDNKVDVRKTRTKVCRLLSADALLSEQKSDRRSYTQTKTETEQLFVSIHNGCSQIFVMMPIPYLSLQYSVFASLYLDVYVFIVYVCAPCELVCDRVMQTHLEHQLKTLTTSICIEWLQIVHKGREIWSALSANVFC